MSAKKKIIISLLITALISIICFSILISYTSGENLKIESRNKAMNLAQRTVQMFVVSTKSFYADWEKYEGDIEARKRILKDWTRTIFAVDKAVTHNFGEGKDRVRLVADKSLLGYPSLGGKNTKIEKEFEREYLKRLLAGDKQVLETTFTSLRLALPLPSSAHPGCVTCHVANIEGVKATTKDHPRIVKPFLLGSLNVYIPLVKAKEETKNFALKLTGALILILVVLFFVIFIYMDKLIISPFKLLSSKLKELGHTVMEHSNSLESTNTKLSDSNDSQTTALHETMSSLHQIEQMIHKNVESSTESLKYSGSSRENVTNGKVKLNDVIGSINGIASNNEEIMHQVKLNNEEVSQIVNIISDIGQKAEVINDIVFQTKLLAFNASVEAARAGEHGKGFSVVAEEVGNLASSSGAAAGEITDMIGESIEKVKDVVTKTQEQIEGLVSAGKVKIQEGTENANNCNQYFDDIEKSVSNVNEMVNKVKLASDEQSQGLAGITKAMKELDHVTLSNSDVGKESAELSKELSQESKTLNALSEQMVTIIEGQKKK